MKAGAVSLTVAEEVEAVASLADEDTTDMAAAVRVRRVVAVVRAVANPAAVWLARTVSMPWVGRPDRLSSAMYRLDTCSNRALPDHLPRPTLIPTTPLARHEIF